MGWGEWQLLSSGGALASPARYLQYRLSLITADPAGPSTVEGTETMGAAMSKQSPVFESVLTVSGALGAAALVMRRAETLHGWTMPAGTGAS